MFLFLGYNLLFSQSIEGRILSEQKEPIYYANVLLLNPIDSSFIEAKLTDELGQYKFNNIKEDTYLIMASMLGYEEQYQTIYNPKEIKIKDITLKANSQLLEEMTIIAKKPIFQQEVDRLIVNVKNSITSSGNNVLEIIEKAPGANVDRINNNIAITGNQAAIIYINGKRLRQEQASIMQYLESLSGANVEKIELITNPPSNYDAEGTGGVINIIMDKEKEAGLNGNINLTGGYGERGKYGMSAFLNYGADRISITANLNTNHNYTNQNVELTQQLNYLDEPLTTTLYNQRPPYLGLHDGQVSVDFSLTDNILFSSLIGGSLRKWNLSSVGILSYDRMLAGISKETIYSEEDNLTENYILSQHLSIRLNEKTKLGIDYDYLNYHNENPTDYALSRELDNSIENSTFSSYKTTPLIFNVLNADLNTAISEKTDLSIGSKYTTASVNNTTGLITDNGEAYLDSRFTDELKLNENILAFYTSLKTELPYKVNFSGGVRWESGSLKMASLADPNLIDNRIVRLFPTVNLSKQLSQNQISVSYNRRINRPGFQALAPAFYFFDTRSVLSGNIQIRPTVSQSLRLGLTLKTVSLAVSITELENPIIWGQTLIDQENNLLVLIPDNIPSRRMYSFNLNFPIQISEAWSARFNFNLNYQQDYLPEDLPVTKINGFNADGQGTTTYKISESINTELSCRWHTKGNMGKIVYRSRTTLNWGANKSFKNGSKLSLSWNDLFNLGSFFSLYSKQKNDDLNYDWYYHLEGNIIRLSYFYPIGDPAKKKSARAIQSQNIQQRATN